MRQVVIGKQYRNYYRKIIFNLYFTIDVKFNLMNADNNYIYKAFKNIH